MQKLTAATGLAQLALKSTPIEKFLYLSTIRKNSVHLFYRLVMDHLQVYMGSWAVRQAIGGRKTDSCVGAYSPDLHTRCW